MKLPKQKRFQLSMPMSYYLWPTNEHRARILEKEIDENLDSIYETLRYYLGVPKKADELVKEIKQMMKSYPSVPREELHTVKELEEIINIGDGMIVGVFKLLAQMEQAYNRFMHKFVKIDMKLSRKWALVYLLLDNYWESIRDAYRSIKGIHQDVDTGKFDSVCKKIQESAKLARRFAEALDAYKRGELEKHLPKGAVNKELAKFVPIHRIK